MKRLWPLAVAFAAACGPIPAPGPVSISVDPLTATVATGAQTNFTATVVGSKDTSVTWSVKEGGGGGMVDTSGHYTAPPAAGTFHLIATANADPTKSATAIVTVTLSPPVDLTLSPATVELGFQGTQQFTAVVANTPNQSVHWTVMEGASGGSVSPGGLYTAPLAVGTFHVIATADADDTKNALATVTVHSSVAVTPAAAMLNPLQTQPFSAMVMGGGAVSWAVAEGAVGGTIDQSGNYTASAAVGVYHVVATSLADSTVFGTAVVTVTLNPEIGVTIAPATSTLNQGAELQLTATVANSIDQSVTWSVREGALGGSVSTTGHYTAPSVPGSYHVLAVSVADPSKSALATITVIPISVTIAPTTVTVPSGGSQDFTATVTGSSDPSLNWTASSGTVNVTGHFVAAAHGPGTVTVTATSIADPTKSQTATVTVTPVVVAITSTPAAAVDQGSTFTFAANVSGGADNSFTWSATCGVFAGSVWTAPSTGGNCVITATSALDSSAKATATVAVRDVAIAITAAPSGAVDQGSTFTFAASVTGSVDTAFSWTASCGSFAGSVWTAPAAAGPCTITATAHADGSKTDQATANVNAVRITITTAPSGPVDQGSTFAFAATVTGSVNTASTFTAACGNFAGTAWTAPNASGPCLITATASANASVTAQVTVNVKPAVVTITSAPSAAVDQGSTFTFAAAATGSVDTGVTWSATCGSFVGTVWTAPAAAGPCVITATSHGDPTSKTTATVNVKAVVVTLTTTTAGPLDQGAQFVFAASASGAVVTTVSWSASCGTMTGTTFTAPNASGNCTVTATSDWDATKKAQQGVAINAVTVFLSPQSAQVALNATFGFVAFVSGSVNHGIVWSVDAGGAGGIVNSSGVYTAPGSTGTDTVRATAAADATVSQFASVAVTTTIAITVNPGGLSLGLNQTQTYEAAVTGATNRAVSWSVLGGAANGTITATGLYTAPSVAGAYTIVATSVADATAHGSATVNVSSTPQIVVMIDPLSTTLGPSGSHTFTATVTGSSNQLIGWAVHEGPSGGNIDNSGHYTAPAANGEYHVVVQSVADPSRVAFATITVTTGPPVTVSVSPKTATVAPSGTASFSATVNGSGNPFVVWSASCGSIDAAGNFTAPATGSCTVTATAAADVGVSASALVTVSSAISVSVSPVQATVAFGDSLPVSATVLGNGNTAVTWSIVGDPGTQGVIDSGGVYSSASATAPRPFTLTVQALSVADGITAGTAQLKVVDSTLHTVSGIVTYAGTRGPGRVYLAVTDAGGAVVGGTSIAAPGAYTIRCLGNAGAYTVKAWRDLDGFARPDLALFPAGTADITFSGTDVSGANVALGDPTPAVPGTTAPVMLPFDRGVAVKFSRLNDSSGADLADHYDVFLSTTPNPGPANNVFSRTVLATDTLMVIATGLSNGTAYYAGVRAVSAAGPGAVATTGPVTAGAGAGTFTVSGRVLLPAASPFPLLVGLQSSSGALQLTTVTNPGTTNPFSLASVPAGSYKLFAVLDLGADGVFTPLDGFVEESVTVSANLNAPDLSLSGSNASFAVSTMHDFDVLSGPPTERWYLSLDVAPVTRIPVRAQLISGVQAADLPLDLGVQYTSGGPTIEGRDFYSVAASPVVGDGYAVLVWYADGTSEVLTSQVNAVLTPPAALAPSGTGVGLTPTFSWTAPAPPPAGSYSYEVFVDQLPSINAIWTPGSLPSTQLSIPYGGPALVGGQSYGLYVRLRDALNNAATNDVSFSP